MEIKYCVFYFVVMFGSLFQLGLVEGYDTNSAEEEIINVIEDGFSLNISFRDYNVKNSAGKVFENTSVLLPLTSITINIIDIPDPVSFILVQAHSFLYNVTLSYNKVLAPHLYTNGSDIGLIQILGAKQKTVQFVLLNPNDDYNATVLVAAQGYAKDAPVPGGCNMEFAVEIAPFLSVGYNSSVVWVESQPAAVPLAVPSSVSRSCEMQQVELEMYHMYLPERDSSMETYFKAIRNMMTVYDVRLSGRQVETSLEGSPMRRFYSSYPGTGSVYGVIAVAGFTGAAYVPAVTYGCDIVHSADSCEVLTTSFSKVLFAIILFLGLFVCFYGHRFFKYEMFLLGFFVAGLLTYISMSLNGSTDTIALEGLPVVSGIVFGIVWLLFWCAFGMPFFSVLIATLSLGFMVASIAMYAGLADIEMFENEINFWVVFASITLTLPILWFSEIQLANIVCCGVLGAYAVILPIDHYIGSNLKYILVNTIRRASVKDFRLAMIDPPFQMRDMILVCVWFGLAALGITYQWYDQRGRPPFPAPPCRGHDNPRRQHRQHRQQATATDRTPLMFENQRGMYGSVPTHNDNVFDHPEASQSTRPFPILPKFPPTAPPMNKELF